MMPLLAVDFVMTLLAVDFVMTLLAVDCIICLFQEIDEAHSCYTFKYLKDKPVNDLADDQFLKIVQVRFRTHTCRHSIAANFMHISFLKFIWLKMVSLLIFLCQAEADKLLSYEIYIDQKCDGTLGTFFKEIEQLYHRVCFLLNSAEIRSNWFFCCFIMTTQ